MKKLLQRWWLYGMMGLLMMGKVDVVRAKGWFYPVSNYDERITVKNFGDLIDDNFYAGKEALFPGMRFYGYHAAVDLEALPDEKEADVSVVAVGDGEILYIGTARGYGGVILQRLADDRTALYGHVDISVVPLSVGQQVQAGEKIAILGDEFAANSGGERKHLHFGIYRGRDRYFLGHEPTEDRLLVRWEDPTEYLRDRVEVVQSGESVPEASLTPTEPSEVGVVEREVEPQPGVRQRIWNGIFNALERFRILLFEKGGE